MGGERRFGRNWVILAVAMGLVLFLSSWSYAQYSCSTGNTATVSATYVDNDGDPDTDPADPITVTSIDVTLPTGAAFNGTTGTLSLTQATGSIGSCSGTATSDSATPTREFTPPGTCTMSPGDTLELDFELDFGDISSAGITATVNYSYDPGTGTVTGTISVSDTINLSDHDIKFSTNETICTSADNDFEIEAEIDTGPSSTPSYSWSTTCLVSGGTTSTATYATTGTGCPPIVPPPPRQ